MDKDKIYKAIHDVHKAIEIELVDCTDSERIHLMARQEEIIKTEDKIRSFKSG